MTTKDYRMAFEELARFRRSYLGDSAWLHEYMQSCVDSGRDEVVIPAGVYYINQPIKIPITTGPLLISGSKSKFVFVQ